MGTATLDLTPLVAPVGILRLFNPHPESLFCGYNGEMYEVRPGSTVVEAKRPMTPLILLRHFCGDDGRSGKLSEAGVRPIFGDDSKDAEIIAEARRAHEEWYYLQALGLKLAHMARIAREKEASVPLTVPDARTRAAMQYCFEVEKKRGEAGAFSCPHCAWPLATEEDLNYHVYNFHPDLFDATKKNAVAATKPKSTSLGDMGGGTTVDANALNPAQRIGVERKIKEASVQPAPAPLKPPKRGKAKDWKEHV